MIAGLNLLARFKYNKKAPTSVEALYNYAIIS